MTTNLTLPSQVPLLTRTGWGAWLAALIVLCALVPVLNLVVPAGSVFHLSDFAVVNPGPQVGIGIGGGSGGGYRSGGFSVGGIGISLPIAVMSPHV